MGQMMEKLKSQSRSILLRITLICLCLPLLMWSCAPVPHIPDHRESGGAAELRWDSNGITLTAFLEYAPPSDQAPRDMTLRFSFPSAWKDVTLSRQDGVLRCTFEGTETDGSPFAPLLKAAELFLSEGELRYVCKTKLFGKDHLYAEIRSEERDTDPIAIWYDPETLCPKQVSTEGLTLTVLSLGRYTQK
jgi:hypothetical protein